jgi:dTDP-4-amino-4,6-dideoxygalactose transaminase
MIPFNKPFMTGRELAYIAQAHANGHLAGNGPFTKRCTSWLEHHVGSPKALLTHSCTAALEMAAILSGVGPGDEVILPSFTFVSTANAFVLRGATPVFVDIRPDTLNIDERRIAAAITSRTRAIVVVHYAGVSAAMDPILEIADRHGLLVIEDAAQGLGSSYRGRPLGSIGHLAALSFHETKNIISGEGGALLINDPRFIERAEHILEKGTNRSQFFRGQVDKYTWVDIGSSFVPGEIVAAFLWAQMEEFSSITSRRLAIWTRYDEALVGLEEQAIGRRPRIPADCDHNAHMYYLVLRSLQARTAFIARLLEKDIQAVFHYVPLHDSPFGAGVSRTSGPMSNTLDASERVVRLPLWIGIEERQDEVIAAITEALSGL